MSELPRANIANLLVSCQDQRGIVAALAQVLYGHGANILDADQHTDTIEEQFFQRIRFDLSRLHTDKTSLERAIGEVAERFSMRTQLAYGDRCPRMAIFVSKYDHCLHDLLWRRRAGELECEIPLVISNHPLHGETARQFEVEFRAFDINSENKREQETAEVELLREKEIDVVVMARYMQILTPEFLEAVGVPVINIHHSFLPAFQGGKPYHQAYERGVKLIGATAHYATSKLDEGWLGTEPELKPRSPVIAVGYVRYQSLQRVSHAAKAFEMRTQCYSGYVTKVPKVPSPKSQHAN